MSALSPKGGGAVRSEEAAGGIPSKEDPTHSVRAAANRREGRQRARSRSEKRNIPPHGGIASRKCDYRAVSKATRPARNDSQMRSRGTAKRAKRFKVSFPPLDGRPHKPLRALPQVVAVRWFIFEQRADRV